MNTYNFFIIVSKTCSVHSVMLQSHFICVFQCKMFNSIANYLFGSPSDVECAGSSSLRDLSAAKTQADGLDRAGTAGPSKKKGEWVMINDSTSSGELMPFAPFHARNF